MKVNNLFIVGLISSIAIGSFGILNGCTRYYDSHTYPMHMQKTMTMNQKALGWVSVLDKNEIQVSKLALSTSHHAIVRKYAKQLIVDHSNNLNQNLVLSHQIHETPMLSEKALILKQKGAKTYHKLSMLSGKNFDIAYLKEMVKGHTDALHVLNKKINKVSNYQVKNYLEATRQSVMHHLEMAKSILHNHF